METYLESLSLLKGGSTLGGCRGLKYLPMQTIFATWVCKPLGFEKTLIKQPICLHFSCWIYLWHISIVPLEMGPNLLSNILKVSGEVKRFLIFNFLEA